MKDIERGLRCSLGMGTDMASANASEPTVSAKNVELVSMQENIQLTAERDMYKKLYENLLEKVVG